jgi:indolepyruvate ferredoxin oxidoreductase
MAATSHPTTDFRQRSDRYQLTDRVTSDSGTVMMSGVQALARLPVEQLRVDRGAGLNTAAFVSGYPGSPLAGLDMELARAAALVPDLPIVCRPAVNEELGVTAVMGSQLAPGRPDARYDGVVGLWYGKAPGLDRSSDALRHAVFCGTAPMGGAVAIVGDDPEAKSSPLPSSSDATLVDLHIPILYPADVAEALELGRHAIALSRASGLWVGLKIVTSVADGTATVDLDPSRVDPVMPTLPDGSRYGCVPDARLLGAHSLEIERELRGVRTDLAIRYGTENGLNRVTVQSRDAWLGIIASGVTYRELMAALERLGLSVAELEAGGVRVLEMKMPVPFDPAVVRRFAQGLEEVMVVEEMNPTLERLVRDALYGRSEQPLVTGKEDRHGSRQFPEYGPLYADSMVAPLHRALENRLRSVMAEPAAARALRFAVTLSENRTPAFCSGCPHNRSTRVPDGTVVGAGIGCHTMVMLGDDPRLGEIVSVTAMGNEGAPWIGMAEFVDGGHFTQNLGDGTYFHSGRLAVSAAVAAGVDITFKLLFNGHVAMTGGQLPPGGRDLASVVTELLATGVAKVVVTSDDPARSRRGLPPGVEVAGRGRVIEVQEQLRQVRGVTVMVHDQTCSAELRRQRHRGRAPAPTERVVINTAICEGCGDCAERSSCLSVQPTDTPLGRKTRIDQASCNVDLSCLEGDCPAFVTVRERPDHWWRRAVSRPATRRARREVAGAGSDAPEERDNLAGSALPEVLPEPPGIPEPPDGALGTGIRRTERHLNVRMAGIGGTGVVTAAQIVATAAMLDGLVVRGLDQTGRSQKAGPVISDLRLSTGASEAASNHLGGGQADLLVAFDGLVAASDGPLAAADSRRTHLVASTSVTPTAHQVLHPEVTGADPAVRQRLARACAGDPLFVDAGSLAEALTGDPATGNVVLLGAAVQSGALPISIEAIRRAISLNGVMVEANLAAFEWGRCRVADPSAVERALEAHFHKTGSRPARDRNGALDQPPDLPVGLRPAMERLAAHGITAVTSEGISRRAALLVEFQDEALARDYLEQLDDVAVAEASALRGSGDPDRLLTAAADGLYRALAYKDEYEVARMLTDAATVLEADSVFDGPVRTSWMLHPPVLRAMGLGHKIAVGSWTAPATRLLARGKFLRGTLWDPFGHTKVRRAERRFAATYRNVLADAVALLNEDNRELVVELAALPERVRGFEDRKLAAIEVFERRSSEILGELRTGPPRSEAGAGGVGEVALS